MPGIFVQTVAFGAVSTSIGLAEDLQKGLIERFRALPMARSAVLTGRTTADLVRNVFRGHHHRGRAGRRVPAHHRRPRLHGRGPAHPALRLRPVVGLRGDRAVRPQQRDRPGDVVPHAVPADLRLVGLRPGLLDAELAAGLRHLPAGERDGQRLPGADDRRSHRQVGHPDPGLDHRAPVVLVPLAVRRYRTRT